MKKKIGIVGTGFIAKGLMFNLAIQKDLEVTKMLTRRDTSLINDIPNPEILTNSLNDLIEHVDIVVECSGDAIHATEVALQATKHNIPMVTMNSEFQVTTASYFVDKGLITEAEGDQPGCLAALKKEVEYMGFKPLVYGNIKSFLDENPPKDSMLYWAEKQGISLPMVTSFTDGTKLQIEQVLVANGLDSRIVEGGLRGIVCEDAEVGAKLLAEGITADDPISDYVLCRKGPGGVFIVADHAVEQAAALAHLKMGEGPYVLMRNYHLCHLEMTRTILEVAFEEKVLINNSANPKYGVAAIAKKPLKTDQKIDMAIGSFELRGEAINIAEASNHVPIGLIKDAVITKDIKAGEIITFDDVELPNSLALEIWTHIREKALNSKVVQVSLPSLLSVDPALSQSLPL